MLLSEQVNNIHEHIYHLLHITVIIIIIGCTTIVIVIQHISDNLKHLVTPHITYLINLLPIIPNLFHIIRIFIDIRFAYFQSH